jgi:hypothetical protein
MNFLFVENILNELGITNPVLDVVEANTNLYQAILYQHKGILNTDDGFSNNDTALSIAKFTSIIQLARESNSSLLVTPEYSCPWQVVSDTLADPTKHPANGKLWVLGCESITTNAIQQLRDEFDQTQNVKIIFEENVLNGEGNFLDPLCYIFRTVNNAGASITICIVQFKTQHMGVRQSAIERDNYIPGDRIYIFRNNPESIYLFSLICSEALTFEATPNFIQQTGHRWATTPYLILNIQLNPAPNHADFRQFKRRVLHSPLKEIITLNWAQGSRIALNGQEAPLNNFSRSGFSTDIDGLKFESDSEFLNNHIKGLYYTFYKPKFHFFHLNGLTEVFRIQNSKPFQGNGPMAFQLRSGPKVLACYNFNPNYSINELENIDDGLLAFLNLKQSQNAILRGNKLNSFEKERLICISAGEIEQKDGLPWFRLDRIRLCTLEDDGVICRLTFTQDEHGHEIRTAFLDKIDRLNHIIGDAANVPRTISFLSGNCLGVMFFHDGKQYHYNFNLVSTDNRNKATGAFCGRLAEPEARKKFNNLIRLFTDSDQQRKRVVVWYEPALGTINSIYDNTPPSISDDYSIDPSSIKKA